MKYDKLKWNKDRDIKIQYFKQNPVEKLYERLGFVPSGETEFHYQMMKPKQVIIRKWKCWNLTNQCKYDMFILRWRGKVPKIVIRVS